VHPDSRSALFFRRHQHNFALLLLSRQLRLALVERHLSTDIGVHGPHFGEEILLAVTIEHQLVTLGFFADWDQVERRKVPAFEVTF
jgi:hypothetical protein